MQKLARVSLAVLLLTAAAGGACRAAISITATGSWVETIDENDLAGPPGSDLIGTYQSAANQVSLSVSGTANIFDGWRVYVRRSDSNWHDDLHLWLRRTSNGTGLAGLISGGTSYIEVTNTSRAFFTGRGDRAGINVQLRMTGVSVAIPADTYTSTVCYTIVDI